MRLSEEAQEIEDALAAAAGLDEICNSAYR